MYLQVSNKQKKLAFVDILEATEENEQYPPDPDPQSSCTDPRDPEPYKNLMEPKHC
jgi:hypothetical protein